MDRRRRSLLAAARLYAICDAAALERMPLHEIDVLQLRDKSAPRESVRAAAERARAACAAAGTLFIVNDDPQLAREVDADGVHVGQHDMPVGEARAIVGAERIVGLSTHTPGQIDAARTADYIGVGPVYATPTKPGREPVGLELVRHAARHAAQPFFAIGGIDTENAAAVRAAGATRIAVVRAIADAPDPAAAARALREEQPVGA
jgi:thiamine-phosphate pyrophosphorylase